MTDPGVLSTIPLLADLDRLTLANIARSMVRRSYRPGDTLVYEGDPAQAMFCVLQGRVRLARTAPDGREQVLDMVGPGEFFNFVPILDNQPNHANARAMSQVDCLLLPRDALLTLIDRHPDLARALLHNLASQLRDLVVLVEDLAFRSVRERLARQLLREATKGKKGMAAMTHQELAERTGTVREIAGRALRQLAQEGLVRLERGRVIVLDAQGLEEIVNEPGVRGQGPGVRGRGR